jgi:hypothetical protein
LDTILDGVSSSIYISQLSDTIVYQLRAVLEPQVIDLSADAVLTTAHHHHKSHIILVLAISLGQLIQGISLAIPVVVWLLAVITELSSIVCSSLIL